MKLSDRVRKSMDDAVSGLAISWPIDQWADEVAKIEEENEALRAALRTVYKGPDASAVDFTKLPKLCEWVCNTIDMVSDALLTGDNE